MHMHSIHNYTSRNDLRVVYNHLDKSLMDTFSSIPLICTRRRTPSSTVNPNYIYSAKPIDPIQSARLLGRLTEFLVFPVDERDGYPTCE